MKPLDFLIMFLIITLVLGITATTTEAMVKKDEKMQRYFEDQFKSAVEDSATYMALLEAQQENNAVTYSREKQLSLTMDLVSSFYHNLALKFGVEGDPVGIQNIMMHVPGMVLVEYDGYSLVTLTDSAENGSESMFVPTVWPKKPFYFKLDSGSILYFTFDENSTLYDPNSNQYLKGTYEELRYARDLSPIRSKEDFENTRKRSISKSIERDLAGAVNRHLELASQVGLQVQFTLPQEALEDQIDNIGFYAFVQGYPLPGGEELTTYAFGGGSVTKRKEYIGVIRQDGRHVAYDARCGIPAGSTVIERIYSDKEAAKKGYFVKDCGL